MQKSKQLLTPKTRKRELLKNRNKMRKILSEKRKQMLKKRLMEKEEKETRMPLLPESRITLKKHKLVELSKLLTN